MKQNLPAGTLIAIGGRENKKDQKTILSRIIAETRLEQPRICVITLATDLPLEVEKDYRDAFRDLRVEDISTIHYAYHAEADQPGNISKIKKCDAVFFSGGDQLKLSRLLSGSQLLSLIKHRLFTEENFVIAGTSAGAVAMSDTMIAGGNSSDALIKGELEMESGLKFINNVFIDTHFIVRGRFGRLIQAVVSNPPVLGIGLAEDTAVVISKGNELHVEGSGLVVIVDGTDIQYTNLMKVSTGDPLTVEGVKLHIIGPGEVFLLDKRRLMRSLNEENQI